jgi:hypothetical protein
MKAKAKKPVPRARKKPAARKSAPSAANGVSSPYGYRVVENKWLNKHPEKLREHAGSTKKMYGTLTPRSLAV